MGLNEQGTKSKITAEEVITFLEQIIKEKKPDIKKTIGEISPLQLIQLLDERFLSGKIKEKKYNRLIGELTDYIASQREILSRLAFDQYQHFVEMEDQQKIELEKRVNELIKTAKSDDRKLAETAQNELDGLHAKLLKKIVLQDKAEVEDADQLGMLVIKDIYSRKTYNEVVLAIEHWIEIIVASLERGDFHTVKTIYGKVGEVLVDLIADDKSHFAEEIFEAWDEISAVLGNPFILNCCMTGTAIPEMSGYQAEVIRNKEARELNIDLMEKTLARISNLQMQNRLYVNAFPNPIVGLIALSSKDTFTVNEKNFKSKQDALIQTKKETKKALRNIPANQLQSKIPSYYLQMVELRRYAVPRKEYGFEQKEWPALTDYITSGRGNWRALNQFVEAYRRKNADRKAQLAFVDNVIATKEYFLRTDHSGKYDPATNEMPMQADHNITKIKLLDKEVALLEDMREVYLKRVAILTLQDKLNECVQWSKKVAYLNSVLKENKINVLGNDVVLDSKMRYLIEHIYDTVVALEKAEAKSRVQLLEKIKAKAKIEDQASASVQTDKPQMRYTTTQKQIEIPAELDQEALKKLFKAKQAESLVNQSSAKPAAGSANQSSADESVTTQKLRKNSIFTFIFDSSASTSSVGSSMSAYAFSEFHESPIPSILIKSTPTSSIDNIASVVEEKEGKKEDKKEVSSEGSSSSIGSSKNAGDFFLESPPPSYSSYKIKSTPSPSSSSEDVASSLEEEENSKESSGDQEQTSRTLQRTKRVWIGGVNTKKPEPHEVKSSTDKPTSPSGKKR